MRAYGPWQALITQLLVQWLLYFGVLSAAMVTAFIGLPHVCALLLFAAFVFLTLLGPTHLSWNRNAFLILIPAHFGHQMLSVLLYGLQYSRAFVLRDGAPPSNSFSDGLFFSWGVWTTLGTEFSVSPAIRWLPLLQATTALIFVPVLASLLWEMLVEMTAPSGEAWNEKQEQRRAERGSPEG
jgi:hypothetical protein